MYRRAGLMVLVFAIAAIPVSATEWEEIEWSATVVSDYKTGLPAIIFNTGLSYDEVPEMMQLGITWEVFSVDGSIETMLYEYTKNTARTRAALRIYMASEPVLIEAGTRYGARVWIEDLENGLFHERSYTYFAPQSLPVGLRLVDWDGTEEADLAGMPDEELEELVLLQRAISSYEVIAEDVSISSLFSQYAATDEEYPVSVILLPETGVDNNWGSESQPITVTFGLTVLVYSIPSSDAKAGFQEQLQQYEQTFTGTVYAGTPGDSLGQGVVVFLHDAMEVILDAALAESAARSE